MSDNLAPIETGPELPEEGGTIPALQDESTPQNQESTSGDASDASHEVTVSIVELASEQQTPASTEPLPEEGSQLVEAQPEPELSSSEATEVVDHEPQTGQEHAQAGKPGEQQSDMSDMFTEEYTYLQPKRGEIRQGRIIAIEKEQIIVDLGLKREGHIPASDLQRVGPDIVATVSVGDEIPVYVVRPEDREGNILVSWYRARQEQDWLDAQHLYETGEIWEGQVKGYNRGGLIVPYGKIRGFIPASHLTGISRRLDANTLQARLADMVGRRLPLKVIEVDRRRRRLIFSERLARREWRLQQREKLLNELQEGDRVHGVVSNVCDFGVFVDIGGTDGLVHISELSWRRTRHPSELVKVGDEVDAYVLNVDRERKRIGLSFRLMEPDPWETVEEKYEVGQLVTGVITKITNFGAFAALDDNIEGLIHISELAEIAPKHPDEVVTLGMALPLRIVKIDSRRRRMGLSLKRVSEEERAEWEEQRGVTAELEEQAAISAEAELPTQEAVAEETGAAAVEVTEEVVAESETEVSEALPIESMTEEPSAQAPTVSEITSEPASEESVAKPIEPPDELLPQEPPPEEDSIWGAPLDNGPSAPDVQS